MRVRSFLSQIDVFKHLREAYFLRFDTLHTMWFIPEAFEKKHTENLKKNIYFFIDIFT